MTRSLGQNQRVHSKIPRRYPEKKFNTTKSLDSKKLISNAVMKGSDGAALLDGEWVVWSGGKDIAIVYEDHVRIEKLKWEEECRKMELVFKRFAKGAIARTSEIFAPGGPTEK